MNTIDFFDSELSFEKVNAEKLYDCRENCFMALYRDVAFAGAEQWLNELESNGFKTVQHNENNGNVFDLLERDGLHITALYTPCDSSLRVTAGENPVPPNAEAKCSGSSGTVFYGFENDHTYIDCGMCLLVQCPDNSFFVVERQRQNP